MREGGEVDGWSVGSHVARMRGVSETAEAVGAREVTEARVRAPRSAAETAQESKTRECSFGV